MRTICGDYFIFLQAQFIGVFFGDEAGFREMEDMMKEVEHFEMSLPHILGLSEPFLEGVKSRSLSFLDSILMPKTNDPPIPTTI